MTSAIEIRESVASDIEALDRLYPAAFPEEDLLPLVHQLLAETEGVLSLVATLDARVVGHVAFTRCGLSGTKASASLLGPLAVDPAHHGKGLGSALVRDGLARVEHAGSAGTLVLGDPAYYRRFGFEPEVRIQPPYPLPAEWAVAWQSRWSDPRSGSDPGVLVVPAAWSRPALWAP
jgi:putative acetyltransferase